MTTNQIIAHFRKTAKPFIAIDSFSDERGIYAVFFMGNTFGFADGIFVNPGLIAKYKLTAEKIIQGNAILSFNKSKNEWGWKAFEIN